MKILLLQDVDNLGHKGDIVTVRDGYGRNYLIPGRMAVLASDSVVRHQEELVRQRARKNRPGDRGCRARQGAVGGRQGRHCRESRSGKPDFRDRHPDTDRGSARSAGVSDQSEAYRARRRHPHAWRVYRYRQGAQGRFGQPESRGSCRGGSVGAATQGLARASLSPIRFCAITP